MTNLQNTTISDVLKKAKFKPNTAAANILIILMDSDRTFIEAYKIAKKFNN